MSTKMTTVPGRLLAAVPIQFKKSHTPREGGWNLNGQVFNKGSILQGGFSCFQIQILETPPRTRNLKECFEKMCLELNRYGIRVEKKIVPTPSPVKIERLVSENYEKIDKALDARFAEAARLKIKWLWISIPHHNAFLYAVIKTLGDTKYGIHTVVIRDENLQKVVSRDESGRTRSDPGLIGNEALKFCAKSGGVSWTMDPNGLKIIDGETMVVGIDVTHPSPGSQEKAPSIAAIVASYDASLSGWAADLRVQTGKVEMVEALKELMEGRLKHFRDKSKRLPSKIIVYRDGVSEGQFKLVINEEYPHMVAAFERLYGDRKNHPKVSIIVSNRDRSLGLWALISLQIVGKRHHTRFYPTAREHADTNSYNTLPGTVVDRHITGYGEKAWDFYLQAHKALQGTARSAHYVVIKNEIGFKHHDLERMVRRFSHSSPDQLLT